MCGGACVRACMHVCGYKGVVQLVSLFHSERYRQADLSMLALRVVTARVFVILSGSFPS